MKKLSFLILTSAVLLLASCASAPKVSNISTIPEIAPGSLPAGRYIVLGEVTGESTFVVRSEDMSKEYKNAHSSEPTAFVPVIPADNGNYGFIGKKASTELSIMERAAAAAEYKLITTARYNDANAVICVNTDVEVENRGANIIISTKVSGLAIRIKPDEGYSISEYVPEVSTWNAADFDLPEDEMEDEAEEDAEGEIEE